MRKTASVVLFLAFTAAFTFGSRIDQGSTDSGHSGGCTQINPDPSGTSTNSCAFFFAYGSGTGGTVESIPFGDPGNPYSAPPILVADVYYFNGASGNRIQFSQTAANPAYGLFLCGDGTKDGPVGNQTMS